MFENIVKSASKIMGFCIFGAGVTYAFMHKSPAILESTFMFSSLLVGTKTVVDKLGKMKNGTSQ